MARTTGIRTVGQDWECTLSLSPKRVLKDDQVTMTVLVSPPDGNPLPKAVYERLAFIFTADDPRMTPALDAIKNKGQSRWNSNDGVFPPFRVPRLPDGDYQINVTVTAKEADGVTPKELEGFPGDGITGDAILSAVNQEVDARARVTLQRTGSARTPDQALWPAIRNRTAALDFTRYQRFIDKLFCSNDFDISSVTQHLGRSSFRPLLDDSMNGRPLSVFGPYAYDLLKLATQVFLTLECGLIIRDDRRDSYQLFSPDTLFDLDKESIRLDDPSVTVDILNERLKNYLVQYNNNATVLPYLKRIVTAVAGLDRDDIREVLPYCYGILQHRLTAPALLELIWSYWHEEGMLVQTMNMIAMRFQNRRISNNDPLAEFEVDPLRPLNNLIWGFIQDEHNRLSVPRRASEYSHHYGLSLVGKATAAVRPADNRSKFIEAFHNLLHRTALFYREDADTTVIADAFPLLNALKEVHLVMAAGAHNQFGDLPWTARCEMLIIQWLLARPEMREFLRGRYMVPYQESWMGGIDAMKRLQGWTDTTVTHFHELAVTGERILLSIRYGDWVDIENIQEQATNWARYWRPEVQRYIHGYQAVTGVDLMADVIDTRDAASRFLQPSALLQRRLAQQRAQSLLPVRGAEMSLPVPEPMGAIASRTSGYEAVPVTNQPRVRRPRPNR